MNSCGAVNMLVCVQAIPSSPLLSAANTPKRDKGLTHANSSVADVDVSSSQTNHREHNTSNDTAPDVPKPGQKPVPSKRAANLFTDDDEEDLFSTAAPSNDSKVVAISHHWYANVVHCTTV